MKTKPIRGNQILIGNRSNPKEVHTGVLFHVRVMAIPLGDARVPKDCDFLCLEVIEHLREMFSRNVIAE